MKLLKNFDAVRESIVSTLRTIEVEFRPYETDIYIRYDEEAQTGAVYECPSSEYHTSAFVWIGSVPMSSDDATSYIDSIESASEITGIPADDLIKRVAEYHDIDTSDVSIYDICSFIRSDDSMYNACVQAYKEWIESDFEYEYGRCADAFLDREFEPVA